VPLVRSVEYVKLDNLTKKLRSNRRSLATPASIYQRRILSEYLPLVTVKKL
jgi:hypothetical protein